MRVSTATFFLLPFALLAGCSITQEIVLAKANPVKKVQTVARVPDAGNSPQMDSNLDAALQKEGLSLKAPLVAGTRKSGEVDAIVSYVDVWRWDLAMYLQGLTVRLYDAETGDLLVTGQWSDSTLHAFRDAKLAVQSVVSEMLAKLRSATKDR